MGQQLAYEDALGQEEWERILQREGLGAVERGTWARHQRVLSVDGAVERGRVLQPLHRDATPEQRELRKWLVPLIEDLKPEHQDLIYATFYERIPGEELAARLELARRSARDRLSVALNALVRRMALEDPEFVETETAKPRRRGGQVRDLEAERAGAYRAYLRAMDYED